MKIEQEFIFNEQPVRVKVIDDEIYIVAMDISEILGYSQTQKLLNIVDDDEKLNTLTGWSGQQRKTWILNESGFYHAVLKSTKPEAKLFRKWVTGTVLPAIRKAGKYSTPQAQEKELELQQLTFDIEKIEGDITDYKSQIKTWNQEREQKLAALKQRIKSDPDQTKLNFSEDA